MSHLSLMLLGTPIVQHAERVVTFRTRKALALLSYLAVEGGLHSREKLVALFWPDSGPSSGRATMRSTLAYLRRALKEPRPPPKSEEEGDAYLIIERDLIGFNIEADFAADWLTLQTAWALARNPTTVHSVVDSQRPGPNSLLTQLQIAAELYRGDFLTGFTLDDTPEFDDWASTQRETYHRQIGLIFDRLSQWQAEGGDLISAIETTTRWVTLDPLNEVAHRRLMQLHFAVEDRAAALQAYESCRSVLARELNAEPAPETESLADRIRDFGFSISDFGFEPANPKSKIVNRKSEELPLVGRANEHLALVTAYRAVRRGQSQGVILEGEPGIGKTRLVKEFLGWASAQGADILQGRAFETSSRLPYQPVIEALRERLERENAPDDLLSDLWLTELSRLLPELRERYPDLPVPMAEETAAQSRLFEAVARLCQALAHRTPLILFLDDLQWTDAASLDLLQYTVRRWAAVSSPVLLLFTLRSEELNPGGNAQSGPGLSDWLITLQREIPLTRLTLEPLTLADIQRLVQALDAEERKGRKDFPPAPSLPRSPAVLPSTYLADFSQRLFAETGGQPFFLLETLKMLFENHWQPAVEKEKEERDFWGVREMDFDGVVSRYLQGSDQAEMPPSIQEMIGARLARLSQPAQTACLAAAVLGDHFDFERLHRVAGLEESEGLEALEELLKRGLVREQRQVTARPYGLAHDRFREVVYNQASEPRRRIFHRRAFEVLEALAAPPAELARHTLAAGWLERAFDLSLSAGAEAMRLYAPQAAIGHYSQALWVAQQLEQTPSPQLYRARGRAYETVGDFDQAHSDFQQALAQTQAQSDRQSEWQALQDLGFLWTSRDYAQAGGYFQQALILARGLNEPATLAYSLNRIGNWHANIEQPAKGLGFHQEALAIFEALGEHTGRVETLDLLAMACYMAGNMQQSLVYYQQAIALFREMDNRRGLVFSLAMMSMVMRATFSVEVLPEADVAQSIPIAKSAVQMAGEIGWRAGESHALVALGQNLSHQGQYGAALEAVRRGLSVAEEIKHPLWTTYAHWALGLIYLDLLALPEAQRQLEQALRLAHETGSMFWKHVSTALLSLAYMLQNEPDRAELTLKAVLGSADDGRLESVEWPTQTTMQRLVWYAWAKLALAGREPLLALQIADHLIASTSNITPERPVLRLSALRGEALAALGRTVEAEAALREALALATWQGEPPLKWRIHLALNRLYQAQERPIEAEREFAAAQAIVEDLAASVEEAALGDNFRQKAIGSPYRVVGQQ
jgi:DNA-binding SARP family transcriptional activator/Flp pilus assembly protein TadD